MKGFRVGDRVRVIEEITVTAKVNASSSHLDFIGSDNRRYNSSTDHDGWYRNGRRVDLELMAPAEPPVDSIVIDHDGDAWQRNDSHGTWICAGGVGIDADWTTLQHYGPLTIVREGKKTRD